MKTKLWIFGLLAMLAGGAQAQQELTIWQPAGSTPLSILIEDFNLSQTAYRVVQAPVPEGDYADVIEAAALSGTMACILDVPRSRVSGYAWLGFVQPLLLEDQRLATLPDAQKVDWNGRAYSVGFALETAQLITRESYLKASLIRTPSPSQPWTQIEFMAALDALRTRGDFERVLDVGMAQRGDWFTYAFAPWLQSSGGKILDGSGAAMLNDANGIAFGDWWQRLFTEGYVADASQTRDDREIGFVLGRYAIGYMDTTGKVAAQRAFDDVIVLPNVNLGNGAVTGTTSRQLAVSSACAHKYGAMAFLDYALQGQSKDAGGPLFAAPSSPVFEVAGAAFEAALVTIAKGGDVARTLNVAADAISADRAAHNGYAVADRCHDVILREGRWRLQSCSAMAFAADQ